ncbi:MAG: hypothetical protein GTO02_03345 [Candidatus Dadabacteria bacterium]|nr:hypothetical protein [Candidatus Dadabacteria bacterium]NIQ13463.1 hypothetical protein [Candidatus Dadabacteria bacterium]
MITILSATEDEISSFINKLEHKTTETIENLKIYKGKYLEKELIVAISGVGIKKAKNATNILAMKYNPSLILSVGVSGALSAELNVGDLFLGEEVMSLKNSEKYELFCDFPYLSFKYTKGKILSENRFIHSSDEKKELYIKSGGADCIDMETWGIASIARKYNIKLCSFRVISDDTFSNLPRMEMLFTKTSQFSKTKALKYFINNPHELTSFIRFKYINFRKAKIKLNSFLSYLLPVLFELFS